MPVYKISSPVTLIPQATSTTCWLACFQMLYEWAYLDRGAVWDRLEENDSGYADPDYMYEHGIGTEDLIPAAKALGFVWASGGNTPIDEWGKVLVNHGPLWVAGQWNAANHVIVVIGVDSDKEVMSFLNPWQDFGSDPEYTRPWRWFNGGRGFWKHTNGSVMYW